MRYIYNPASFSEPPKKQPPRAPDPKRQRQRMIREQIEGRGIADPLVIRAMNNVPRHLFVPEAFRSHAYEDSSLPIGFGQTISQPYMVAKMSELANISSGMRILEIGAGSGYQAAVLAAMGCTVYAVERLKQLYLSTGALLKQLGYRGVRLKHGDGTLGVPQAAPFDRIIVSAGGPTVPEPLLNQLGEKGLMLIPVGSRPRNQRLLRISRKLSKIVTEDLGPAIFVDLVGDHGW